ncbi:hypothetical protein IPC436_16200 [Pseudomonas aeruginosa]|nr:hypothetical protein IPC436_16200 [Pseudomonas aeruginosa]
MSLKRIKSLVDELTTLHITKGVQPSDLADNIYDDIYLDSQSRRESGKIVFEISFLEAEDHTPPSKITMRYTYNLERYLMRIEQKISSRKFSIQWDRSHCIGEKLDQLDALLALELPREKVSKIISTLPNDFLKRSPRLKLVA